MRALLSFLLLFTASFSYAPLATASDTTRVLFIGNSFTYVNMVPDIVKGLAQQGSIGMAYAMHAPGGATVGDLAQGAYAHMENPAVFDLIRQGVWDYVVLQDNQGRFLYNYGVFNVNARTLEGHKRIMDSTLHYNPCAAMIWFNGWAFKNGAPPYGNTGIELIDRIDANYQFMNDSLNQIIAPIGAAWKQSTLANPGADLWDTDEAHASLNGSYLTAAVLFCTIFKKDPASLAYNAGLSPAQAAEFRSIAYQTFLDSFARDNAPAFTLPLSYTAGSLMAGTGYLLYEYSRNGEVVATSASNIYPASLGGCFQVKARGADGCWRLSRELCLQPTAISSVQQRGSFTLYPNPAVNYVVLSGTEAGKRKDIAVYDLRGMRLLQATATEKEYKLDLSGIKPGTYLLRVSTEDGSSTFSLLKL
jgi:hypothetical protein